MSSQFFKFIFPYIIFEIILGFGVYFTSLKYDYAYLEWTKFFYHEEGRKYFLYYLLFMVSTTVYFFILFLAGKRFKIKADMEKDKIKNFYLIYLSNVKIKHKLSKLLIGLFILLQSTFFLNYILSDYHLANEYKYMNEYTIMKDGHAVSNHDFYEKYFLISNSSFSEDNATLNDKKYFIKVNSLENIYQTLDRFYIEENAFVLSPINEIKLNRPYNEIFSQYGFLTILSTSKLMDLIGGFNINNYEKIQKLYYLIYFFIFCLVVVIIFKDNNHRLLALLLFGLGIDKIGFYAFNYAPGIVPIRHFFDLFIIILLYAYERTQRNVYLISGIVFSILSIWMSKDFGQFIFLALVGVLTTKVALVIFKKETCSKRQLITYVLSLFTLIVAGLYSIANYPLMVNPSTKYFLDGFYAFATMSDIMYIVALILLQWLLLLSQYEKLKQFNLLTVYLFLIFYTQFLYSYPAWGGTGHFYSLFVIFTLPFLIIFYVNDFKYKRYIAYLFIIWISIAYINKLVIFQNDSHQYNKIFKTHEVFKWDMPRGQIYSTISPKPFLNSVGLIKKYKTGKKIYMISKYDNILAIFAEKYSGFPFFELRSSIVTKDQYNEVKNIIDKKADILFVDNDIDRDFVQELSQEEESEEDVRQRIPKLKVLQKLFDDVKNQYMLVEKGELISVYKKI